MNQHDPLALHTFCGWLAYVVFLTYHLDACEQISLGPHAHLSSWCVWYGLMRWSLLLMFKYLGKFIWKFGKCFAKLLFDVPKSCQSHMMIPPENLIHICYLSYIELCQIVVTLERILFMLSWSRFTCTPYTPLLCFHEKLALYHFLHPTK